MYGIGGVIGAFIGGIINDKYDPFYSFYVVAFLGILICALATTIDSRIEGENAHML